MLNVKAKKNCLQTSKHSESALSNSSYSRSTMIQLCNFKKCFKKNYGACYHDFPWYNL